jgi:hypothetical protein
VNVKPMLMNLCAVVGLPIAFATSGPVGIGLTLAFIIGITLLFKASIDATDSMPPEPHILEAPWGWMILASMRLVGTFWVARTIFLIITGVWL